MQPGQQNYTTLSHWPKTNTGCPPKKLFVSIALGGLYCLYRFMFFLGEIGLGHGYWITLARLYSGFAWFSSNLFLRSVNCKPCCIIQKKTLINLFWGLPTIQNHNLSYGGVRVALGLKLSRKPWGIEQLGCTQPQPPVPLQKGWIQTNPNKILTERDCIAVNANTFRAETKVSHFPRKEATLGVTWWPVYLKSC